MKAVYFKNRRISLVEVPLPQVSQQDALVQVTLAGICATDIELLNEKAEADRRAASRGSRLPLFRF